MTVQGAPTPTPTGVGATRVEHVYARLRSEILSGHLRPGTRLRLVEIAERFSVSQTVVREALTRLAEQRVVTSEPQLGFRVAPLTLDDLTDLTEARVHVEGLVFHLAIERGDLAWEATVVAAHHRLSRTPQQGPDGDANPAWRDAHEAFHTALFAGCGNPRLLHVAHSLRDAAALYRMWSAPLGHDEDRDVAGEHHRLLQAVLARDAELGQRRLAEHIERTTAALKPVAEQLAHADEPPADL